MLFFTPAYAEEPAGHGTEHAPSGEHGGAHEGQASEHGSGHGAAHGPDWHQIGVSFGSPILFLIVLFSVARRPVGDALRARAVNIRKSIDDANAMKHQAQDRFDEVAKRLASLDAEVQSLKAKAEDEAKAEGARLRERAQQDAARIQEVAERTIREESERARRALREEAVRLSVGLARSRAEAAITIEDQRRFTHEFLASIQNNSNNTGAQ